MIDSNPLNVPSFYHLAASQSLTARGLLGGNQAVTNDTKASADRYFRHFLPVSHPVQAQAGSVCRMATAYPPQLLSFRTQLQRVRNLLYQRDRKADFLLRSEWP